MRAVSTELSFTEVVGGLAFRVRPSEIFPSLQMHGQVLACCRPRHRSSKVTDPPEKAPPSEALMARVCNGDQNAFETLVSRHQHAILNFIYRFVGDRTEAEDLAQEVFLRAWRSAPTYKPTARFTTWIYRIATNLCINKRKSDRLRKWFMMPLTPKEETRNDISAAPAQKGSSPEDLLLDAEKRQQVLDALRQLPADQRIALILKRFDGLSYREISRVMGRSVSSVDSLLVRAKRNLMREFAPREKRSQVFGD